MPTIAELVASGQEHQKAGRPLQAEQCFRAALQMNPRCPEAWYLLGLVQQNQGMLAEAAGCFRQAVHFKPNFFQAYNSLGIVLVSQGDLAGATGYFRQAVDLKPDNAQAHNNLGAILKEQGQVDAAFDCYREAIRLNPDFAAAHSNLGTILRDRGQMAEARASLLFALKLRPDLADAHCNLGNVHRDLGQFAEAVQSYEQALKLRPNYFEVHNNLGVTLAELGKTDQSVSHLREASRLQPHYADAYNNLGNVLKDQGLLDEAIRSFQKAVALQPNNPVFYSTLLFALHYVPQNDAATIFAEHARWGKSFADPLTPTIPLHANDPDPDRRLRVGYVSPDFRRHVVASFIEPVLASHNHEQFQIFGYANTIRPDAVTDRLKALTDEWRLTYGSTDKQLCDLIRADQIDILIDLAGHTAGNQLTAFARKPAPIQISHFGYPDTTGMRAVDYRITDVHADPPGMTEGFYTETLFRLPEIGWCYGPSSTQEVGMLPCRKTGQVTFGSLNNQAKITFEAISLWSRILHQLPNSRILLLTSSGSEGNARVHRLFEANGISSGRVLLMGKRPREQYLQLYQSIDIGLDPFPYNGGVTSCDALWMGVPVVALAGHTYVSRQGVTLLANLGLEDWIANGPEEFVKIALQWANDQTQLQELRERLRPTMARSPLTDATRFTRLLEEAYRTMWQKWCGRMPVKN